MKMHAKIFLSFLTAGFSPILKIKFQNHNENLM